jgi:hypothetical protein
MTWQDDHNGRVAEFPEPIRVAHRHSSGHRAEVLQSSLCGCFYCGATFAPDKIAEWIDSDQTALCPHCGIDSVIPAASGFELTPEFLASMKAHWF